MFRQSPRGPKFENISVLHFFRSPLGLLSLIPLLGLTLVLFIGGVGLDRSTRPQGAAGTALDLAPIQLAATEVQFTATDGVELWGSLMPAPGDRPALILCHDQGADHTSLINLAIHLQQAGFPVLLFDFRGHGASAAVRRSLGILERRDVLGAIEFLMAHPDVRARRIGLYGIGMGAHAAVLAAADRREVEVLVLDGLYPDASYRLSRAVWGDWGGRERTLDLLSDSMFTVLLGEAPSALRAADVIGQLPGRDMLLLAPAQDSRLTSEMQGMYETIPDQVDVDGNLVVLPATLGEGLNGEQMPRYLGRVSRFFETRLMRADPL